MIAKLCASPEPSPSHTISSHGSVLSSLESNHNDIASFHNTPHSTNSIILQLPHILNSNERHENWCNQQAWQSRSMVHLLNNEDLSPMDEILQYLHNTNDTLKPYNNTVQSFHQPNNTFSNTRSYEAGGATSAMEQEGLNLLSLLLQCAESVSENRLEEARYLLPQITELSSPFGTPVDRIAAYFAEAMSCRIMSSYLGVSASLTNHKILSAFQVYNGMTPFVKFSHFTANQAIQQAVQHDHGIHIIDLDIMQGLQWPGLFHLLSSRIGHNPPYIRITGVGKSVQILESTGKRLSMFAEKLGIRFEFNPIVGNLNSQQERLSFRRGESVAVHWYQHSLYEVVESEEETLNLIARLRPTVVTVVEQDLTRCGTFMNRFVEAMHYYSAVFDSLGAAYPADSQERHVVEQQVLACEIKNVLGMSSKEHLPWKDKLGQVGFGRISLAGSAAAQASMLLGMFPSEGYSIAEDDGALRIGWGDQFLLTASAWHPL